MRNRLDLSRAGHAGQPDERRREDAAHQEEDELAGGGVVGGEVAAVEQGQAEPRGRRWRRR